MWTGKWPKTKIMRCSCLILNIKLRDLKQPNMDILKEASFHFTTMKEDQPVPYKYLISKKIHLVREDCKLTEGILMILKIKTRKRNPNQKKNHQNQVWGKRKNRREKKKSKEMNRIKYKN